MQKKSQVLAHTRIYTILLIIVISVGPTVASGQTPTALMQSIVAEPAIMYSDCMSLARSKPREAIVAAAQWLRSGENDGALHCRAVALLNSGAYVSAATELESLAATTGQSGKQIRADLLAQAGQAWLIAGKIKEAIAAQTRALQIGGPRIDLFIDRAVTRAGDGDYWRSIDDLNSVIDRDPRHINALILRATAWRRLGNLVLAADDIARAIVVAPGNVNALLERGNIKMFQGDKNGAAADWRWVVVKNARSPAATAARRNLSRITSKSR